MNRDKIDFFKNVTGYANISDEKYKENRMKCIIYFFDHVDILYDYLCSITIDGVGDKDMMKYIDIFPHDFLNYTNDTKEITFKVKVNDPSILNNYSVFSERKYYGGKYVLQSSIVDDILHIKIYEN